MQQIPTYSLLAQSQLTGDDDRKTRYNQKVVLT